MEAWIQQGVSYIVLAVETSAVLVVLYGVLEAFVRLLVFVFGWRKGDTQASWVSREVKIRLGRWLAFSLELQLAADIVRTSIAPSWSELAKLGAIILLRTLLNFFLEKEVDHYEQRQQTGSQ